MKKFVSVIAALGVVVSLFGCSGNYPLKGRVTFSDDGSPLEIGMVNFENEKGYARGELKKGGYYEVGYVGAKDGIPPGTYQVYISGATVEEELNNPDSKMIPLIDPAHTRPDRSGWEIKIDGSTRVYDIKVNRPPKSE